MQGIMYRKPVIIGNKPRQEEQDTAAKQRRVATP